MKIHAALMTQNEQYDLAQNVKLVLPYVDSVTIVDGGSIDGTIPYMRAWSQVEPKIRFFIHPWTDDFPAQRNNYLKRVGEIAQPGDWVLAFDPDEYLSNEALAALRELASSARRQDLVGFRCRSVTLKGEQRVWENLDNYHKRLLIRWHEGLRYYHNGETPVHEKLDGAKGGARDTDFVYEHRKQENAIWGRGVRNAFIGGGGDNLGSKNPHWVTWRRITDELGLKTWHQFQAYLLRGDIAPALKQFFLDHRQDDWGAGSSEYREGYKYFYRMLHPELEPAELRGEYIP